PKSFEKFRHYVTDEGATFDATVVIDGSALEPYITSGTHPGAGRPVRVSIPKDTPAKMLEYMGLEGGKPLLGHPIDVVFIGRCTNSPITELCAAAAVLTGH